MIEMEQNLSEKIPLINEFYELGLGNPYAVSALHGSGGLGDMLEDIIKEPRSITGEYLSGKRR